MKSTIKYMIGAAAGIGMYVLCEKCCPIIMKEMKKTVNNTSKDQIES